MRQHKWPKTALGISIAAALVSLSSSSAVFSDNETDREAKIAALQAQCEADREAKIKPLRDAEIAKCKADKRIRDPDYCERYWADWGAAVRRSDGTVIPQKFDDLPSCVAAFKAKQDLSK